MNDISRNFTLGDVGKLATHKLRSVGASVLLVVTLGIVWYSLLREQYQEQLKAYPGQGDRAYVFAFVDLFLYQLFSLNTLALTFLVTFMLSLALLKNWEDCLLTGVATGVMISLLSLYILKNYYPGVLAESGLTTIYEILLLGIANGFVIGLAGVPAGAIRNRFAARRARLELAALSDKGGLHKCPKCGAEFGSNPRICSNCGQRMRKG